MARVSQRLPGVNGHPNIRIKVTPEARQRAALRRQQREQEEVQWLDEVDPAPYGVEIVDEADLDDDDETIETPLPGSPYRGEIQADPDDEYRIFQLTISLCKEYESRTGREYPDRFCPKEHKRLHRDIAALSGDDTEAARKVLASYCADPASDRDPHHRRKIAIPLELVHVCKGDYYMAAVLAQIMYWFDGRNGDQPTINKTRKKLGRETGLPGKTIRNILTRLAKLQVISVGTIGGRPTGNNWGMEITLHQDRIKALVRGLPAEVRAYCYGTAALARSTKRSRTRQDPIK